MGKKIIPFNCKKNAMKERESSKEENGRMLFNKRRDGAL